MLLVFLKQNLNKLFLSCRYKNWTSACQTLVRMARFVLMMSTTTTACVVQATLERIVGEVNSSLMHNLGCHKLLIVI
jgi:hypothetical protein